MGSGFVFRPAKRELIRLLVGISGGTGSGKSWSGMELATGLSGGKRFAVIDTENGRARLYADHFNFDVADLEAPFTPTRYMEAIQAAVAAGYDTVFVDQFSHEWEGDGGILETQDEILTKMAGDDWKKRDACNMISWAKAKAPHKEMMQALIQTKAHVIIGLRAEDKIEMVKVDGKTVIRPKQTLTGKDGWVPICEKRFPFELTLSFLVTADAPGVPKPIKNLAPEFKGFFPLDKPITRECGRLLAEWAKGTSSTSAVTGSTAVALFSAEDVQDIETACDDAEVPLADLKAWLQVKAGFSTLESVPKEKKQSLFNWIAAKKKS